MQPPKRLPDAALTVAERRRSGQALRQHAPRRAHAAWSPAPGRGDPVRIIIETGPHRIQTLLPVRYGRMRQDALAYLRGTAAVMAADLSTTPASGLAVQACGDCHLGNFGTYASPEGAPVFDINDFDETPRRPRSNGTSSGLATSFAVAARCLAMPEKETTALVAGMCRAYRERMGALARMPPLDAWRSRIDIADGLAAINGRRLRERTARRLHAATEASRAHYPRLIERRDGRWRIRIAAPYTFPLTGDGDGTLEAAARTAFTSYLGSLRPEQRLLVERYQLTDLAFKIAGVAGVGTFCAIGLLTTADGDVLLLQLKEAQRSALAPFTGPSPHKNHGLRVVSGQRILQAIVDPLLGWTRDHGDDRPCYVRQLKDPRMAMLGDTLENADAPPRSRDAVRLDAGARTRPLAGRGAAMGGIWAQAAHSTPPSRSSPCATPTRPNAITACSSTRSRAG